MTNGQESIELSGGYIGNQDNSVVRNWNLSNVNLNVSSSLYIISNNINAISGINIIGNATFSFKENEGIYIGDASDNQYEGYLKATGATFTSQDNSKKWEGIVLNKYSDDTNIILDSCIISNATIGLNIQESSPNITNNIFRNNIKGIVANIHSEPIINGNSFIGNTLPVDLNGRNINGNISNLSLIHI